MKPAITKKCRHCEETYRTYRPTQKYCTNCKGIGSVAHYRRLVKNANVVMQKHFSVVVIKGLVQHHTYVNWYGDVRDYIVYK